MGDSKKAIANMRLDISGLDWMVGLVCGGKKLQDVVKLANLDHNNQIHFVLTNFGSVQWCTLLQCTLLSSLPLVTTVAIAVIIVVIAVIIVVLRRCWLIAAIVAVIII